MGYFINDVGFLVDVYGLPLSWKYVYISKF